VKLIGIVFALLGFTAMVGCEKDVREPGEPRVLVSPAPSHTSADTRSTAADNRFAYGSPNKWT
jgi:hypothetical protein